jgi:hypothetical protein
MRPLEVLAVSQPCPCFTVKTLERLKVLKCGPRPWGAAGAPKFRRSGDRGRPGTGEGRWGAHLGSVWDQRRVGVAPGGSLAAAVAASSPPARLRPGCDHTRRRTLEWRRRKRLGASVCGGDSRRRNSVVAALTAPQRTRETARRLRQRARGARRGSVL